MLGNTELGTSFLKHHLLHLLNICNSFAASTVLHSGIQTVVCHICCSVHQSLISSLSIVSSGEWLVLIWLMVVPWLYYQPWPWHDCFLWVKIWNAGVSIKFEVCSWLEKSNRLYVRPLNLGGSGGMLLRKFRNLEALKCHFQHSGHQNNYHASTSGNYSVCMAIQCEINVKKHSLIVILGSGKTILLTKCWGCICTGKRPVAFSIFHTFVSFLFLPSREKKTY